MDLEEICINAGNLVDPAQDRNYWRVLVNAALNLRVPQVMELVYICVCVRIILLQKSIFRKCILYLRNSLY